MNVEENNALSDLAEAWSQFEESEDAGVEEAPEIEATAEPEEEVGDVEAADTQREEEGAAPDSPGGDVLEEGVRRGEEGSPAGAEGADEDSRPPVSWNAEAREAWKDIPKHAQEYINKREADYTSGLQKNADNAQRAVAMDQALAPFQQFLAMSGQPPSQTIGGLLQTASVLQMGSAPQKAQSIANLIQQFGVDIATLDGVLSGAGVPPEMQQQQAMQNMVQQQLAPLQQQLAQYQQAEQQQQLQQSQQIQSDVERFANDPQNEFYRDVSADMADILELAANRGQDLSLKDAYERACQMNPQVSRVIAARAQQQALQKKQQAAVSVSGSPAGDAVSTEGNSLSQDIAAAWDNSGRL